MSMERGELEATLKAAAELFDGGRYLAAHELFEELWESTEDAEAEFYKGLLQAAIALHHFEAGNIEGAARLYSGHRRCLSGFLPEHQGIAVGRFLAEMQAYLGPAAGQLSSSERPPRPRIFPAD